jgi:3-deoxy-D-manno-octulosonic-acid transferase
VACAWPARPFLTPAYRLLDRAGAVSAADADRLARLGVPRPRIEVLGDPRYDAVLERISGLPRPSRDPTLLVAGSTWPADEAVLLPAFAQVRQVRPDARLLLVPHRPDGETLSRLERTSRSLKLPAPQVRHGDANPSAPFELVLEVGRLALCYGEGALAYVGGGFGSAGLHSVLEPAAWSVPVLVGPRREESADAATLEAAGGLIALDAKKSVVALTRAWLFWLENDAARGEAGNRARAVVEERIGAADACARLVSELITERRPRFSSGSAVTG